MVNKQANHTIKTIGPKTINSSKRFLTLEYLKIRNVKIAASEKTLIRCAIKSRMYLFDNFTAINRARTISINIDDFNTKCIIIRTPFFTLLLVALKTAKPIKRKINTIQIILQTIKYV